VEANINVKYITLMVILVGNG